MKRKMNWHIRFVLYIFFKYIAPKRAEKIEISLAEEEFPPEG